MARRAGSTVSELSKGLEHYRAGQTGLLRLTWDNGDRTVLVVPGDAPAPLFGLAGAEPGVGVERVDVPRRENQSRFENDFSSWRSTRQGKRQHGQIGEQEQGDAGEHDAAPVRICGVRAQFVAGAA